MCLVGVMVRLTPTSREFKYYSDNQGIVPRAAQPKSQRARWCIVEDETSDNLMSDTSLKTFVHRYFTVSASGK